MNNQFTIREFKAAEATDVEFAALQLYENAVRAERTPEDPPKSVAAVRADWQSMPPFWLSRSIPRVARTGPIFP